MEKIIKYNVKFEQKDSKYKQIKKILTIIEDAIVLEQSRLSINVIKKD